MVSQKRRKLALSSANRTPISSSTKNICPRVPLSSTPRAPIPMMRARKTGRAAGSSPPHARNNANAADKNMNASGNNVDPVLNLSETPCPNDLTDFENANLVLQKHFKAGNAQITKVTLEFRELKAKYLAILTTPPTTTAAFRNHILVELQGLCERYEGLLNVRRKMLEKQQSWLDKAMEVEAIQDSDRMLTAIDMQIEATKDLARLENEGALMQESASL